MIRNGKSYVINGRGGDNKLEQKGETMDDMRRANLKQLAEYLETVAQDVFDMENYQLIDGEVPGSSYGVDTLEHNCGTAGCAIGHGPNAGIPALSHESWEGYSFRCFIPKFNDRYFSPEWLWCFSSDWCNVDNTPQGAAARIKWVLDYGKAPADWSKQMNGEAPLCYR